MPAFFPKKFSRKQKFFFGLTLAVLGGILFFSVAPPEQLTAGILPPGWDNPFRTVDEFYQVPEDGNAVDRIKALFWKNIVPLFKYIMVAVAILYGVLYMLQMITSSGNQEQVSSAKKNLLWEFLGFLIIAVAVDVADAFDPFKNNGLFVDKATVDESQFRLISYLQMLAGVIAIFYIFFAGFRMITSHGDEELITEQKNHIKWGFLGLMAIALADPIINRIFYPAEGQRGLGTAELKVMFAEGIGTINFFLAFTGLLAVAALVASGFAYVTSMGDEAVTEKAKKTILSSLLSIVIIVSAYILVVSLLPPEAQI